MTILDYPIRVDREAERISTHNGGASIDFNGNEAQRREAMRFYEQAPRAMRLLLGLAEVVCELSTGLDTCAVHGVPPDEQCPSCQSKSVLRDAWVLP